MREVEPMVKLIAKPQLRWPAIREYLEEVGGQKWYRLRKEMVDERLHHFSEEHVSDGQDLIEFAGRSCYRSYDVGLNANVTRIREDQGVYFTNLLASGHGSVLEHANYSFIFYNVSRVFTHEVCRHRAGTAISQESMRFVRLTDIPFWIPEWAHEDPIFLDALRSHVDNLEEFQKFLAQYFDLDNPDKNFGEKKAKTSFMRRFAPDGVATMMVWTANVRALRHVITMRTDSAAEEEIRIVFDKVAEIMQVECPLLFGDMTRTHDGMWRPKHRKV